MGVERKGGREERKGGRKEGRERRRGGKGGRGVIHTSCMAHFHFKSLNPKVMANSE